jgi:phosphoglycolate phosphatase
MKKEINADAVILDVDGTLWDSTPIVARAWQQAAIENDIDIEILPDTLKGLFGRTMDKIAEALLPNESLRKRTDFMDACTKKEHEALIKDPCHITYPLVVETIKELSRRVPVAIVSNCQSGYIELFLEKTGLAPYVKDKECFGDTGEGKAYNIKLTAKRNGWKNPVYVGDTEGDRVASKEAGVRFIYASYGFGNPESCYDSIASFEELLNIKS